jgi:hypothetical protein
VSFSWVDPHFAALYARREEERLAERLEVRLRECIDRQPSADRVAWREPSWMAQEIELRGRLRLL